MKRTTALAVIGLAIFITNLDASIVTVALPTLATLFDASANEVSRVALGYLLALAALLLACGRVSDLRGAGGVFVAGFGVFGLASGACGLAPTLGVLVVARLLQGAGGAMLLASFGPLVIRHVDESARGRAFGLLTLAGGVGFALGGPIGGLLVSHVSWRWIFLVNVPLAVLGVALGRRFMAQDSPAGPWRELDLWGVVLSVGGLAALVLALTQGSGARTTTLATAVVAVALLQVFVKHERSAPRPLLDLRLLRISPVALGLLANTGVVMLLAGESFLFPFYFEHTRGLAPDRVGLLLAIFPALSIVLSPLAGRLVDRLGARLMLAGASAALVAASALLVGFSTARPLAFEVATLVVLGGGLAVFFTANPTVVLGNAPVGAEGVTSALNSFSTSLGSMLGIGVFELLFSWRLTGEAELAAGVVSEGFSRAAWLALGLALAALVAGLAGNPRRRTVKC